MSAGSGQDATGAQTQTPTQEGRWGREWLFLIIERVGALARRVLFFCECDGLGATDALIRHRGSGEIRPRAGQSNDWHGDAGRRYLAFRLSRLGNGTSGMQQVVKAISD